MVERGQQLDGLAAQQAVAEHVAAHVTDATAGDDVALGVDAHLPEAALGGLPRAAGGDAGDLVVVAGRAARGERVVEPEAVLGADAVGGVAHVRGALVGRDHEVRIGALLVEEDAARRHGLAVDEVVGDRQQRAHELLVVEVAGGAQLVAVRRRVTQHEAALGTHRDDHDVLHHLRRHQPVDLGAEVVGTIGEAQAAAGDPTAAQVHALEVAVVDPDLAHRLGLGAERQLARRDLERQRLTAGDVGNPGIGAPGGANGLGDRLQHAVGGVVGDLAQGGLERRVALGGGGLAGDLGVEARAQPVDELLGDVRVIDEGLPHEVVAERQRQLVQVGHERAQDLDVVGGQVADHHQAVEIVVAAATGEHLAQRLGDVATTRHHLADAVITDVDAEVVHVDRRQPRQRDVAAVLVDDLEAEVT
ncbi:MAG: hypothetical protein IPN32_39040, partial [Deltaproteobacteria bacterium]|nr:hypothetical protein [Deltaproteobacteria bacterium]